jgi:selenocysteine lyase/cysteine desulfurase
MVGAAAAVEFLASFCDDATLSRRERLVESFATLHRRGESLFERLWSGLSAIDGVTLYGVAPGNARTPTVSFRVRGHQSESVSRKLVKRGVYASHGDFYATTIIQRLGLAEEGVVRAGCSCYTNQEEIDRLIEGVSDIVAGVL